MGVGSLLILVAAIVIGLYLGGFLTSPPTPPEIKDGWWGRGPRKPEADTSVHAFKIKVPDNVLTDLKTRLQNTRYSDDLENTNFEYGFQTKHMKTVVHYWRTKYEWSKHEAILNSFPQFKTNIEGIDVHFLRVKPPKTSGVSLYTCKNGYTIDKYLACFEIIIGEVLPLMVLVVLHKT